MADKKSKPQKLQAALLRQGVRSIAQFARDIDCSRVAVYLALERPSRFPRIAAEIQRVMARNAELSETTKKS